MDVRRFVHRFARKQRLLLSRISRAEELADTIACDLAVLERLLQIRDAADSVRPVPPRRMRQLLGASGDVRASELTVRRRPDDWGFVRIDQSEEFALPPTLVDLLVILSADVGSSPDDLVGWKSLEDIAKQLGKKTGRGFTRHAITQQLYRLRRELLTRAGLSPLIVQTHRRFGARVALRRLPLRPAERTGE